jgi:hypothetical protein
VNIPPYKLHVKAYNSARGLGGVVSTDASVTRKFAKGCASSGRLNRYQQVTFRMPETVGVPAPFWHEAATPDPCDRQGPAG